MAGPPVTYQMPPSAQGSAVAAEAWARTLPPAARAAMEAQMRALVATLAPARKADLVRYLVANRIDVPPELMAGTGIHGLGVFHGPHLAPGLGPNAGLIGPRGGMGQWAAIASGLIQAAASVGAQVITAKTAAKGATAAAAADAATQQQIAQMNDQAAIQAQQIISSATVDAAKQAAGATKAGQQVHATELPTLVKWGTVTVLGVAVIGFGFWAMSRRPRASAPAASPAPSGGVG